eukprot:14243164-Alexandrium_andersonii.AAC.1
MGALGGRRARSSGWPGSWLESARMGATWPRCLSRPATRSMRRWPRARKTRTRTTTVRRSSAHGRLGAARNCRGGPA